jgi:hypothetical protein
VAALVAVGDLVLMVKLLAVEVLLDGVALIHKLVLTLFALTQAATNTDLAVVVAAVVVVLLGILQAIAVEQDNLVVAVVAVSV